MAASLDWQQVLSSVGPCNCSICTGQGLNQIAESTTTPTASGTFATSNPLTSIPQLSSNPNATAKLYLDFNGHTQASWGSYSNAVTPVYDQDGDRTTFSSGELASISEIWARVAEDYAPFNIDVTTINPNSLANGVVAHIAIGGNYTDWFGGSAGGVAYIGGFYNGAPNVGYVFEDALGNGNARYVAEAASHEAGHLFGLLHQSVWNGSTLQAEYSQGNGEWAPIMGVGYYSQRTTWHNGPTSNGPAALQDDMTMLSNFANGFGYRADDFGSTLALASALAAAEGNVQFAGRIGTNTDEDWFSFTTDGGALNLTLNVAQFGANLDSVLELRNASGTILVTANPSNSLGATLTSNLTAGTYYVVVKSSGGYGNVGQYTISGTVPDGGGSGGEETPEPEINVNVGATALQSGGTVSFGTVQVGNTIDRTITVKNTGTGTLTLQSLVAGSMPPGFTLVSNLSSLTLATNETATFTVQFNPSAVGATTQSISLLSDDADEAAFEIKLSGTATPVPEPEIVVSLGTVNVATGGTISFGSVAVGNSANKVITVKNTGPGVLNLQSLVAENMPPGFTLVSNLSSLTLTTNQTATFTIRFEPSAVGATNETLTLLSNDSDEGSFVINLTGTATPAPQPEIVVTLGTVNVATGGTVNFGSAAVGNVVNKIITVKNTGPGVLNLQSLVAESMPPGFALVSNLSSLTLATNQTATFTVRFAPSAVGATAQSLTLLSNDADEGSFVINLTGTATPAPQPEIAVSLGTVNVATGGTINFGSVSLGSSTNKVITVKNTGPGILNLTALDPGNMPPGFTLVSNLSRLTLTTNQTATFTVSFTPSLVGAANQTLNLLSNDADEATFALKLVGTATPAPQPEIAVSLGTVNVLTGGTINFGSAQVNTSVNRVITIKNTGPGVLNLQALVPGDMPPGFTLVSNINNLVLARNQIATFTVRFTPSAVGPTTQSLSILSNDSDEGTFQLNLVGTATPPPAPEVNVAVGTSNIETGGNVDFGNVEVGQYVNKVITVKNTGNASLTLQKLLPANMPAGFTIVANLPATTLAAGKSMNFTIRFTASSLGNVNQSFTLFSNDADEGSFQVNVSGTGTPAPVIRAIDNGAAGFTSTGTWTKTSYQGRESDIQTALKGNGSTTATWTFTAMPAGVYKVHASWTASTLYATNAPYTVYDGATQLSTVVVNQERASSGLTWGGTAWSNLGTFEITGDTVRVVLTNLANDRVVADAVRIERISDLPDPGPAPVASSPLADLVSSAAALPLLSEAVANETPVDIYFSQPAPFWAPALSLVPGGDFMASNRLSASTVDALFSISAETGEDTSAELQLLDTARDLMLLTSGMTSGSVSSTSSSSHDDNSGSSEEPSYDSLPSDWLLDGQLDRLLT